ncbi:MFS transporter [Flavipsychrobacter stenotrophus]|uniref:MFS transporter n=1 Tax=Flavipsychrobacter stenotrophus TaxID=2077091 RepID=A0A2S7T1G2_9BACT|nr:peptide MFS transporter [Flavipsychrobacter stenotrophus]PQJ13040.1 MFS transporter [Flavipsychrobacter stenotrophus]
MEVVPSVADAQTIEEIQNFKGKYPKQLWYLFLSEMWERFAFYGMRGMLTIFMVEKLLLSEKDANLQYGATQAFVYTLAFVGGLFADKILGFRKSVFWGGILMIIGSFTLACMPQVAPHNIFYLGISFTIVGTGFFKPNISTMVGRLYKTGDTRKDAGFGLFYSGINIGAVLGGWACIHVANTYSWNAAFSLAGIVMTISLIIFLFTKRTLSPIGLPPVSEKQQANGITKIGAVTIKDIMVYAGSLLSIPLILILVSNSQYTDYFMYTVGPLTLLYIVYEMFKYGTVERQKLMAAMIFVIFSIFFWAFFEQAGGSLSLFARYNLNHQILGMTFDPNEVNNSSNSVFVILFSPLVGLLWLWLSKRKIEPNTVVKFGLGFLFVSASFYIFYYTRFFADADGKTSLNIFTLAYLVTTIGELCLSPIGLSIMTSLSPKPLHGVMMGMWFLASAYGQYAAGLLGAGMATANDKAPLMEKLTSYTEGYKHLALYALIAGIVLIAISPLVRKLMHEVH